ncbi:MULTISPECIES: DNA repair protein RadC [Roseibium]|uniref:RadC family protein n=1 Tax=Roseibium TaxID=150830 RepID=UPI003263D23D
MSDEVWRQHATANELLALEHDFSSRFELQLRCRKSTANALTDLDVLTLLLEPACSSDGAHAIARHLLLAFGSLPGVLSTARHRLLQVEGVDQRLADILVIARQCALRCTRAEVSNRCVIECWTDLLTYLQTAMGNLRREQFRVVFLNKRNEVIVDEVLQEGTVDHTPVYPREVMRRALMHHASALILVHNHPSGDPTPSQADILMTHRLVEAAEVFDISIYDHIIVAEGLSVSFKGLELI